jgi:hypothetical protein
VSSSGGSSSAPSDPQLDQALVATWPYAFGYFYPDPPGTPGEDVTNPPPSLQLAADGTFTAGTSKGTWSVGATTAADWQSWHQQYDFHEKVTLHMSTGQEWTGYVDDGDPSGATSGPPQCIDLFYTQTAKPAGYFWLSFCAPRGSKK